jgi:ABC-type multidrug transport system permease subunit
MMRDVWFIGCHDLKVYFRNRAVYVWLFVVPLVFVYFMGFANRGPGDPSAPRPVVRVVNLDSGYLGAAFLEELGMQGLDVLPEERASEAKRVLRVPEGFTESIESGRSGTVTWEATGVDDDPMSALVELRVMRAVLALNGRWVELAGKEAELGAGAEGLKALRERPDPVSLDSRYAGRRPIPSGFYLSLPGVMVMYVMMNTLIFGGASLAWARRSGVLRRMRVHPVSRGALLGGKIIGLILLGAVQVAVFLAAGKWWFGVDWGDSGLGVLLVLLVYAWVAAALGVLLGSVVRGEEKVTGLCILLGLVMAALGGCWWPLEVVPQHVRTLAYLFPTGWAMDALHQLITYGNGLAGAREELGVLVLFGLAAQWAAVRWFRD